MTAQSSVRRSSARCQPSWAPSHARPKYKVANPSHVPSSSRCRPHSQPVACSAVVNATGRGGDTCDAPGRANAACSSARSSSEGSGVHTVTTVGRDPPAAPAAHFTHRPAGETTMPSDPPPTQLTDKLMPIAAELIGCVHDYGPAEVAAVLARVPDGRHDALAVVLAAMVDPDRPARELLAWVDQPVRSRTFEPGSVRVEGGQKTCPEPGCGRSLRASHLARHRRTHAQQAAA